MTPDLKDALDALNPIEKAEAVAYLAAIHPRGPAGALTELVGTFDFGQAIRANVATAAQLRALPIPAPADLPPGINPGQLSAAVTTCVAAAATLEALAQ